MNTVPANPCERRLLILAPIGRDAPLIAGSLDGELSCLACRDLPELKQELERGAAAVLVAEEALLNGETFLPDLLADQPPWSDLPVLLLTHEGADSALATRTTRALGNVTLLERPVRVAALVSAVRSALRARDRQYQARAHIEEREEADRRKNQFLATLAHELRNPLAPIRSSIDALRLAHTDPAVTPAYDILARQVGQMVRLVDDLMDVSRISRGKFDLRREPVDLGTVIAAAVETSRPLIEAAGHELLVSMPSEPLWVAADMVRLAQVFSNLLNNAAKFTRPGGRIAVLARREDGDATIFVRDTGIGIHTGSIERIFAMFEQAPAREGATQAGLGIGLTLARSLVEMHGGTIAAHSDGEGHGSTFMVRLPLDMPATLHKHEAPAATAAPVNGLPRVVVVDDNRDAADSLGAVLQMIGAETRVAYDGHGALETIDEFRPAAVLLDLGMPGMNGYQVAQRIRAHPGLCEITLVALTGWGQSSDRERTRAAGFDSHLVKPVGIAELQPLLASLLERART